MTFIVIAKVPEIFLKRQLEIVAIYHSLCQGDLKKVLILQIGGPPLPIPQQLESGYFCFIRWQRTKIYVQTLHIELFFQNFKNFKAYFI